MTDVITTITRDDPRFDSARESEWFKDLPDSFFVYLNVSTILAVGAVYCDRCSDITAGYAYDGVVALGCAEHIYRAIARETLDYDWRNQYIMADTLEPFFKEILPIPAQEPIDMESCAQCNHSMYDGDVYGQYSWAQTRYRAYSAQDNKGNIVKVHKNCTYICSECSVDYVHGGAKGVQNYNVNNKHVCSGCWDVMQDGDISWSSCDECGTYLDEDNDVMYSEIRSTSLCSSCYEIDIECDDCGYCYYEDDGHQCEDDDPGAGYVHSYGYKPRPVFFGQAPYHLGLELEVEAKRSSMRDGAEIMYNAIGERAYLKYDGSLSDGFEIVTHPHSLLELQDKFPWAALTRIQEMGFRSWNTSSCGIHVHVSRTAFKDDAHQIKFTKLIYDNQRQVERLAGRKSSYAKFNDKGKIVAKVKFGNQSDGRYSAVNNENENTLEVRVFRGSLRKERVLSALEFTHAAVEYTKTIKVAPKDKPLSWARFIAFVVMHHDVYPNLLTIISELFDKENEVIDQEEVDN